MTLLLETAFLCTWTLGDKRAPLMVNQKQDKRVLQWDPQAIPVGDELQLLHSSLQCSFVPLGIMMKVLELIFVSIGGGDFICKFC